MNFLTFLQIIIQIKIFVGNLAEEVAVEKANIFVILSDQSSYLACTQTQRKTVIKLKVRKCYNNAQNSFPHSWSKLESLLGLL